MKQSFKKAALAWPRPPSNPGTLWPDPAIAPPYVGLLWWVPPWASPWLPWGRPWPCPPVVGRRPFISGRDFETGRELEIDVIYFFGKIAGGQWPWHIWRVIAGGWHIWGVRAGGRWHDNPSGHFFFQISILIETGEFIILYKILRCRFVFLD